MLGRLGGRGLIEEVVDGLRQTADVVRRATWVDVLSHDDQDVLEPLRVDDAGLMTSARDLAPFVGDPNAPGQQLAQQLAGLLRWSPAAFPCRRGTSCTGRCRRWPRAHASQAASSSACRAQPTSD